MTSDDKTMANAISEALTSSLIGFSVIVITVLMCLWAFSPFLPIMLWALVLSIALFPVYLPLKNKLGGASGRAATMIVIVGLLLIGVPTFMMGSAFASQIFGFAEQLAQEQIQVPAPPERVVEWPFVGEKLFAAWSAASVDLPAFLERLEPQLAAFGKWLLGVAAGTAGAVFQLIGALVISGIMLAWSEEGSHAMRRVFVRFVGASDGPGLQDIITKTVRSVATGIIGIAFITSFLMGVIFVLAGIPAAGVLAVIALFLGIMQIPVSLVALVGIALLWAGDHSTVFNVVFSVLMLAGSMIDNVLKPMLLGRGIDVPMPVILIGALGGMMSGGILGMFIGSAFLAAGYQVFIGWVDRGVESLAEEAGSKPVVGE